VNEAGEQVRLRGLNLGNWLQLELWMMASPFEAAGEIHDQCTLEGILRDRFGQAEKERLLDVFRESWMQERDWDNLAALGMNLVRLPFSHHLVEDEEAPLTLRDDAFVWLDRAIDEAEKRGIYTILDLHGAAGGQGWEQHTGCEGKNELWGSEEYRGRTKWLWEKLAERYKDRAAVAGYGLLNEPWGTSAEDLAAFSWELYDTIRAVDDRHIVVLPGHSHGIWAYGNPSDRAGTHDVALEMHFYPGFFEWRTDEPPLEVHNDWLDCTVPPHVTDWTGQDVCERQAELDAIATPGFIGEFQPWVRLGNDGGSNTRKTFDVYNDQGWAAAAWSYKVVTHDGSAGSLDNWGWGVAQNQQQSGFGSLNVEEASSIQIEEFLSQFATQELMLHPGVLASMNESP
jgi:hypothetical protein